MVVEEKSGVREAPFAMASVATAFWPTWPSAHSNYGRLKGAASNHGGTDLSGICALVQCHLLSFDDHLHSQIWLSILLLPPVLS
ncbi:hypothetical protein D3C86_1770230 [compost metagenome]